MSHSRFLEGLASIVLGVLSALFAPLVASCGDEPVADADGDADADADAHADAGGDAGGDADTESGVPADADADDSPADADTDSVVEPDPLDIEYRTITTPGGETARFAVDVAYGDDPRTVFDIALPDRDEPTPLIVYIHGGGFTGGDKSDFWMRDGAISPEVVRIVRAGVAVASINYRLLEEVDHDGVIVPLTDSARCLQFLRYHAAATFNVDRDRVGVMGGSAGAGTAIWLGVHDDLASPAASDPIERMSTRPQAVAAAAAQATYDILRWPTDVFADYADDFADLIDALAGTPTEHEEAVQTLLSFYGVDGLSDLETPEIQAYRADVDMLGLMDGSDVGFWVANVGLPVVPPTDTNLLYHHAFHARALERRAEAVGLDVVATYGEGAEPPMSRVDYLLEELGVSP